MKRLSKKLLTMFLLSTFVVAPVFASGLNKESTIWKDVLGVWKSDCTITNFKSPHIREFYTMTKLHLSKSGRIFTLKELYTSPECKYALIDVEVDEYISRILLDTDKYNENTYDGKLSGWKEELKSMLTSKSQGQYIVSD